MLFLEASTRHEFHSAVSAASQAILAAGGWVVSHQFFARSRAVIGCEIPAEALPSFAASLDGNGLSLHQPAPDWPTTGRDIAVQLAVTIVGDTPDNFRRDVPAFG